MKLQYLTLEKSFRVLICDLEVQTFEQALDMVAALVSDIPLGEFSISFNLLIMKFTSSLLSKHATVTLSHSIVRLGFAN